MGRLGYCQPYAPVKPAYWWTRSLRKGISAEPIAWLKSVFSIMITITCGVRAECAELDAGGVAAPAVAGASSAAQRASEAMSVPYARSRLNRLGNSVSFTLGRCAMSRDGMRDVAHRLTQGARCGDRSQAFHRSDTTRIIARWQSERSVQVSRVHAEHKQHHECEIGEADECAPAR